jgi:hypothetical protein
MSSVGPWRPLALLFLVTLPLACDGQFDFDRGAVDAGVVASPPDGAAGGATDGCAHCAELGLTCASEWQACVECNGDGDCPSGSPYCDPALHRCAVCDVQRGCGERSVCDGWSHQCVRSCASENDPDHDCDRGVLTCDLVRSVCMACTSEADCASQSGTPHCLNGGARCAECRTDADCTGAMRRCDPLRFSCVECADSRDCVAPLLCSRDDHRCVEPTPG